MLRGSDIAARLVLRGGFRSGTRGDEIEVLSRWPPVRHGGAMPKETSTAVSVGAPGTPFIGREREMDRVAAALEMVLIRRQCHVVLVTGEGGVGKSRLVQEALDVAASR